MTKNQINHLKLLGYTNTQEDGAILQHNSFSGMSAYVWEESKFEDVLSVYALNLESAVILKITNNIKTMAL